MFCTWNLLFGLNRSLRDANLCLSVLLFYHSSSFRHSFTPRALREHSGSTQRAPRECQPSANRAPTEHRQSTNRAPTEHSEHSKGTKRSQKEQSTESNQTVSYYQSLKYFVLFLQFFGVCEKHRFLAPKELGGWWLGCGWLMVGW